jgi:acetyl esterase/lipase
MFQVLTEEKYGDGNIIETMLIGNKESNSVSVREVPMEALYPTVVAEGSHDHLYEEEEKLAKQLEAKGMRE